MQEAIQMWDTKSPIISAEEFDTIAHSIGDLGEIQREKGWVCPYCYEPVYFRPGTYRRLKSTKIVTVSASFCHYKNDAIDSDQHPCELKSASSAPSFYKKQVASKARNQRFKLYEQVCFQVFINEEFSKVFTGQFSSRFKDIKRFKKNTSKPFEKNKSEIHGLERFVDLIESVFRPDIEVVMEDDDGPRDTTLTEIIRSSVQAFYSCVLKIKESGTEEVSVESEKFEELADMTLALYGMDIQWLEDQIDKDEEFYEIEIAKQKKAKRHLLNVISSISLKSIQKRVSQIQDLDKPIHVARTLEFIDFLLSPINTGLRKEMIAFFWHVNQLVNDYNYDFSQRLQRETEESKSLETITSYFSRRFIGFLCLLLISTDWNRVDEKIRSKSYKPRGIGFGSYKKRSN